MRGLVKYLALLLAGILAASCIFDAGQCVVPADEERSIMFTVSLDNQRTRASWKDSYDSEDGVPFDYRIMPDELRVVVFDADGNRIGTIQDLDYWPINENQTEFQFIGLMPEGFAENFNEDSNSSYKFMVLANCGDNLSGEQYITYNHSQLNPTSEDSSIPMWGVKLADMSPLVDQETHNLGEISLLRAAAKIEVKLSDALKDKAVINSATLKYYNKTGYVLPEGAMSATDTRNLDQENCFNVYRHAAANLPFVKDENTGDYYIYVTEYDNTNYSGERNKISLGFEINGVEKHFEDAISFCQYSGGKPLENTHYNIVRNHIYEFEILSIAGDNLVLEYEVADWNAENWKNGMDYEEHDLTYPTYHNPVMPKEYLTLSTDKLSNYEIKTKPTMYYVADEKNREKGAFECFFNIQNPEKVQWKPGIMGAKTNYRVRVYSDATSSSNGTLVWDSGEPNLQTNLGPCASDKWYRIVVFPLSSEGAGKDEVDFMISYYQSWTEQYIHLYINGEYDHIRWPDSGTNPKLLRIKHVAQNVNGTN